MHYLKKKSTASFLMYFLLTWWCVYTLYLCNFVVFKQERKGEDESIFIRGFVALYISPVCTSVHISLNVCILLEKC